MTVKRVNYSKQFDGIRIRVMCPECGSGGAHYIDSYQPKCHCKGSPLMQPASNNQVECTWEEFKIYLEETL